MKTQIWQQEKEEGVVTDFEINPITQMSAARFKKINTPDTLPSLSVLSLNDSSSSLLFVDEWSELLKSTEDVSVGADKRTIDEPPLTKDDDYNWENINTVLKSKNEEWATAYPLEDAETNDFTWTSWMAVMPKLPNYDTKRHNREVDAHYMRGKWLNQRPDKLDSAVFKPLFDWATGEHASEETQIMISQLKEIILLQQEGVSVPENYEKAMAIVQKLNPGYNLEALPPGWIKFTTFRKWGVDDLKKGRQLSSSYFGPSFKDWHAAKLPDKKYKVRKAATPKESWYVFCGWERLRDSARQEKKRKQDKSTTKQDAEDKDVKEKRQTPQRDDGQEEEEGFWTQEKKGFMQELGFL